MPLAGDRREARQVSGVEIVVVAPRWRSGLLRCPSVETSRASIVHRMDGDHRHFRVRLPGLRPGPRPPDAIGTFVVIFRVITSESLIARPEL